MDKFERLLKENTGAVERFIKLRVASGDDAEDILQEVLIAAFQKFGTLKNE